jgi:hypothetical protein
VKVHGRGNPTKSHCTGAVDLVSVVSYPQQVNGHNQWVDDEAEIVVMLSNWSLLEKFETLVFNSICLPLVDSS